MTANETQNHLRELDKTLARIQEQLYHALEEVRLALISNTPQHERFHNVEEFYCEEDQDEAKTR